MSLVCWWYEKQEWGKWTEGKVHIATYRLSCRLSQCPTRCIQCKIQGIYFAGWLDVHSILSADTAISVVLWSVSLWLVWVKVQSACALNTLYITSRIALSPLNHRIMAQIATCAENQSRHTGNLLNQAWLFSHNLADSRCHVISYIFMQTALWNVMPCSLVDRQTGGSSTQVKRPGREADHSPTTSAEVKKMWLYTSTPPYAFMT
jgi:hypothetical protein